MSLHVQQHEPPLPNRPLNLPIRHRHSPKPSLILPLQQRTHHVPKHHAARHIKVRKIRRVEIIQRRVRQPDRVQVRMEALLRSIESASRAEAAARMKAACPSLESVFRPIVLGKSLKVNEECCGW